MNLFSFVGAIAFCPEFARRNGSTAFSCMDVAWMRAREHIYVHSIYIGHMPIGTTRQNSVHFVNLASTHFTSYRYSWLHDESFAGEKYLRYLKLSRSVKIINLPFPEVHIIIFNAADLLSKLKREVTKIKFDRLTCFVIAGASMRSLPA